MGNAKKMDLLGKKINNSLSAIYNDHVGFCLLTFPLSTAQETLNAKAMLSNVPHEYLQLVLGDVLEVLENTSDNIKGPCQCPNCRKLH